MPKKARTEAWRKKRRQEHLEMKKYRYYIFCEGQETEPNYFQGFKKWIEENPIYKDHACNRNGRRICEKEPTSKRADMVRV